MPLITVCIPVFQTEAYLLRCLKSVCRQDFSDFEILVVSDASRGRDEKKRSTKKIVSLAQKECNKYRKENSLTPVKIRFIEHSQNRGCVEVRRTLVYESRGSWLTMLDSDDELMDHALKNMYQAAHDNSADIVHGTFEEDSEEEKCSQIFYGTKEGKDILMGWFTGLFSGNICGKLISKSLYEKAYEQIPYTECNMADDLLIFFFIGMNAKKYVGIKDKVYYYHLNTGMSSRRTIDSLKKWQMICSASSVFSIITQWVKENHWEDISKSLSFVMLRYLKNSLDQLSQVVSPDLQPAAHQMLCDYWGEHFVQMVEGKTC